MATDGLLPDRSRDAIPDRSPELVRLDDADEMFDALASETSRRVLLGLCDEPATASDVAERVGTSIQNARYHLTKLREAGLVEVVDTWYSSKGAEMDVYAPASDPLYLFAGSADGVAAEDLAAAQSAR